MAFTTKAREAREELVNQLVKDLESGKVFFWDRGFKPKYNRNLVADLHGKEQLYHGGNALRLWLASAQNSWKDTRWATFEQIKSLQKKGVEWDQQPHLKKGAKGVRIEYWSYKENVYKVDPKTKKKVKVMVMDPDTGKMVPQTRDRDVPLVKQSIVYNGEQIENIPPDLDWSHVIDEAKRNEAMEAMLKNSEAKIFNDQTGANYYTPATDEIHLVPPEAYKDIEVYYATAAHEVSHSTGAANRLNREGITGHHPFGSEGYAKEELRAELSSMFLAQDYGISLGKEHYESHAAYVQSWIKVLKDDPDELFRAAADAQKSADYIRENMIEKDLHHTLTVEKETPVLERTAAQQLSAVPEKEWEPKQKTVQKKAAVRVPHRKKTSRGITR